MKWPSVKNILLGMLIVMNLFVLGELVYKRFTSEKIPPVILAAAADALENSGISCDSAILPDKYVSAGELSASFFTPDELSRMFFGSQLAFQTDGRALIAHSGSAELTVEDASFVYKTGAEPAEADEAQLRSALEALGINMKHSRYSAKYNVFCYYIDNAPLFGAYIRAEADSSGRLCTVEACWPKSCRSVSGKTGVTVINHLPYFGEVFEGGGTVERIRFGYALSRDYSTGRYKLSPAWKVTMRDGRRHVFM